MDPFTVLAAIGLLGIGWLAGRLSRRPKQPTPPRARCGCGHDLALHDPHTTECHGSRDREVFVGGLFDHTTQERCSCRQYVGPKPVDELISFPMLPPAG